MYCHDCGAETKAGQTYCTACGAELVYRSSTTDAEGTDADVRSRESSSAGRTPLRRTEQGEAERQTDHPDRSAPQHGTADRDAVSDSAKASPTAPAGAADESDRARELAGNALFGYGFVVLLRLTGISGVLFAPHAENPFFATALHDIGVFVFYDGFLLAVTGFVASAYLTARHSVELDLPDDARERLDAAATVGLSGASLLYALGVVLSGI